MAVAGFGFDSCLFSINRIVDEIMMMGIRHHKPFVLQPVLYGSMFTGHRISPRNCQAVQLSDVVPKFPKVHHRQARIQSTSP